ncbi:MAG: fibronectin type III domain-containing protein, partial [Bacteroidales bacterium]|nr:fibronectin type III domain-containing protein [Bacteroidales bacterium]
MKKVLFLLLATVMLLTQAMAQQDSVSIGSATTTSSTSAIPGLWGNHRSVHLYSAEEMNLPEGGMIEGLALDIASVTSGSGRELRIYMKEVNDTTLPENMTINALDDDAVLVYNSNGPLAITANAWNYITLQTPFLYSGAGSLYIFFEGEGCTASGGCSVNVKGANGASKAWTKCWDTSAPDLNAPIARSNDYRANIRLFYSPATDDYCYPVSGITASNPSIDGIDLSWTSDNNSFVVEYKLQSESWDSENVITENTSSTEITLSGLLSSSFYEARIKSICPNDESSWMSITFSTECDVISTFPWSETFNNDWSYNPMTDTAFHPAPLCWLNMSAKAANSSYIAKQNANDAYLYGYGSSSNTNETYRNSEWLMTPVLELTGGEVLNFFTKKSSASYSPELRIYAFELSDGDVTSLADTSNFFLIDSITTFTTNYEEKEISLEDLSGQFRLAFVRNRKIGHGAVYVNDVMVKPAPTCDRPSNLVASNITGNSVDLTWTEVEGADSYNVYYKTSAAADWTIVNATEVPFTLTGLEQTTAYTINVQTVCSDGTESGFILAPAISVTTTCVALVPPVLETFDTYPAGTGITNCWKEGKLAWADIANPDSTITIASNSWDSYSNYVFDSHAAIELYSTTRKDWLISPQIDLGDGSIAYDLKFDLAFTYWNSAADAYNVGNQKFAVAISTDGGQTWDMENAMIWDSTSTTQEGFFINDIYPSGQRVVMDLSEYTGNIVVGFYGEQLVSGGDNRIHIDNFQVVEHVDCLDLLSFDLAVATPTSVAISWPVPEDSDYDAVIIYNEGDTIDWENGITENVSAGTEFPYILEGLSSETTYTFSVAFDCGGQYAQPITITMPSGGVEVPFICDFDDPDVASLWTINNGTHATKLYIGALSTEPDNNKLYVSSDNGATLSYSKTGTNVVTAAVPLQFPEEGVTYKIKFDYKGGGESTWDYIKVLLLDLGEDISATTASTQPAWAASTYAQEGFLYPSGVKFNLQNNVTTAEIIVPGELVNGTSKNLVFAWRQDSGGGDEIGVEIDNVSVVETACSAPTDFDLAEDGAQTNSLTFDLETEQGDEWEINYKVYGAESWESLIVSSSTGIQIDDLLSGTMYQFRVRSICGEDTSWWAPVNDNGYVLYQTLCEDITISEEEPFVETFDAPTWFRSGNITTEGDYAPSCWFNIDAKHASYNWRHVTTASNNYNGSAGSLAMYSYSTATADTISDWFITPIFNLSGEETFSFYAKTSTSNETLKIMYYNVDEYEDMTSGADTANFELLTTINLEANSDWNIYDISLSELSGRTRLAFYASVPGYYIRIDEVMVHIVDCQRPEHDALVVSDITPTSAVVNINDENNSEWTIYYKPENAEVYDELTTTDSYNELTDLLSNTTYEFYVVANCGGSQSQPSNTITFVTPCAYVTELPYTEGFEADWVTEGLSNVAAPSCWININGGYNSSTYKWTRYTTASSVYDGLASAQSYGYTSATSSTYVNNDFLITPAIDVEGGARLRFYAKKGSTSYNGKLKIKYYDVTENGDMTSAADTANFIDLVEISNFTTTYEEYTFDIPELPSTYRIAFARQDTSNGYIYIDNVSIDYVPSCIRPEPASVVASNITTSSATISWTDNDESHSSWNVYYRMLGTEEYIIIPVSEPSVELTDLVSAESYEVYVTTNCGNEESEGTYVTTFSTLQESVEVPYTCDFEEEGTNGWLLRNGSCTNKWYVGTPASETSGKLFITNNNGGAAQYTISATSIVVAEKLFQLGATDSVRISFDLTIGGETTYDYLKVYWLPVDTVYEATTTTPYYALNSYAPGTIMSNASNSSYRFLNSISTTQNMSVTIQNNPNELRKLVFVWKNDISGGNQPGAIIDNVMVEPVGEEITCFRPVDNSLVASNIYSTSATISWEASDESQSAWNVYYKTSTDETYTMVTSDETSIELTDLLPQTQYTVYVTTNCGSEESTPSTTLTFRTECTAVSVPWSEDFTTDPITSTCWSRMNGMLSENVSLTSTTSGTWTYSSTAVNGNSTGKIKNNVYGTNKSNWILTPMIDLGESGDLYELSFDLALTDYNYPNNPPDAAPDDKFAVVVSEDGVTWSNANVLIYADGDEDTEHNFSDFTNTFSNISFALQDAEGNPLTGIVRIGFYVESTIVNGDNDLFIDNLSIALASGEEPGVTAPVVTTLAATAITHDGATLNGTITAGSETITEQGFKYKATAAADWTTVNATGETITATLTTLISGTEYAFKAFATTATGTVEGETMTFTTTCGTVTSFPYVESFEGLDFACWTVSAVTAGAEPWELDDEPVYGEDIVLSPVYGNQAAVHTYIFEESSRLASPILDLSSLTNPYLKLSYARLSFEGPAETLTVQYRTTADGTWTTLTTLSGTPDQWILDSIALPTPSATYQIAFTSEGVDGYGVAVDYLTIYNAIAGEEPEVIAPVVTTLAATAVDHQGATLNGTITAGSEEITAQGFMYKATAATDWTTVNATGTTISATLSALTAETEYTFKAFATTATGTVEGEAMTFTTTTAPVVVTPPTVATLAATAITHESATLNGTITAGSETITAQGFMYKATAAADWTTVNATGTTISATLSALTAETEYTF